MAAVSTPVNQSIDPHLADETIESKVEKRLTMEDRIAWKHLKVDTGGRRSHLYGLVRTEEEKGWAAKPRAPSRGSPR